jgi:hypothetical protein
VLKAWHIMKECGLVEPPRGRTTVIPTDYIIQRALELYVAELERRCRERLGVCQPPVHGA